MFEELQVGSCRGNTIMYIMLQSGVETSTELLAEIIARPHLKTPRSEIIQATKDAHMNRLKFLKRLRQGELASVEEELSY